MASLGALLGVGGGEPDWQAQRDRMVREQIEQRGVRDTAVLNAMRKTPRHLFVPADSRHLAYSDRALSIEERQTISQPYIVAAMSELLEVRPIHRVLEIGTGSGYQAAILSQLARQVYSIEIVPSLARASKSLLEQLHYNNVTVREGDGYQGWLEHAPFDRIILTAAPPEVPQALVSQLRPGGRLVAPVGAAGDQQLIVIEKAIDGSTRQRTVFPVQFVPMVPKRVH